MPELPDLTVYVDALSARIAGRTLERVAILGPSLVRTADPHPRVAEGRAVVGVRRIGKQIVWEMEDADRLFLVFHLMIAGRFHWKPPGTQPPARTAHAAFAFSNGTVLLTEAAPKKRASLHAVRGEAALNGFDRGGLEPLAATPAAFRAALTRENHTLKRALTDPRLFAGIGNAYSDEALFHARLSPLALTSRLDDDEIARLYDAVRTTLAEWTERLRAGIGDRFPERVTAFHPEMAVHGRFRRPCPRCGAPVQRIVYAENETNYCAPCQTGGRLLADRSLSRLLHDDWPRDIDDLEARIARNRERFGVPPAGAAGARGRAGQR